MFNVLETINRNRCVIKHVEVNGKTYDFDLYYNLGGMNFFTGKIDPRGIFLSIKPVERSIHSSGTTFSSFTLFSGYRKLLEPLPRFSQKKFDTRVHITFGSMDTNPDIINLFDAVVRKNKEEK